MRILHRPLRVLACAALLASCGGDDAAPASPAGEIHVTLEQYRADEVAHRLEIQVTNRGGSAVHVATARIDWPGLADVAATVVDYAVAPGITVDLAVDYGDAVCSDPPLLAEPLPDAPIVIDVVTAEGETLRWPVDDTRGVLARVHGLDCRRQAVAHLVDVRIGGPWTPIASGDAVTGELRLTRRQATGPARLAGISGSVLLDVAVAPGAPTTMTGDELVIPVVVTSSGRCEAHALADSKKTFDFQVTIELDGVPASISVAPEPADETTVFGPVEVTCGLTS